MDVNKNKTTSKLNKVDLYKAQMEEIGFMAEHLEDVPEIFDVRSSKCKLFLIKAFTVLHPNFHYLSLLGNDSIGQELAKAASILQIYPTDPVQKSSEIFHNMSETDIHRFWMRFFKLCKLSSSYVDSNSLNKSATNIRKFNSLFCDVNKTVQYFNHDISIINPKKLKGIDISNEIKSWIPSDLFTSMSDESARNVTQDISFQEKHQINVDIDKLITDIDYIKKKADFEGLNVTKPSYPYENFFINFNRSVKVMKNFRDNINCVSSFIIQDLIDNTKMHKDSYWLSNNCQIKRCNNIIQNILLKENV